LSDRCLPHALRAPNVGRERKKVKQVPHCPPTAVHIHFFQDLGKEDKEGDEQRCEHLADGKGSSEGDGHREFHRHPQRNQVFQCLFEDRVSADESGNQANHIKAPDGTPQVKPSSNDRHACQRDPPVLQPPGFVVFYSARLRRRQFRAQSVR